MWIVISLTLILTEQFVHIFLRNRMRRSCEIRGKNNLILQYKAHEIRMDLTFSVPQARTALLLI